MRYLVSEFNPFTNLHKAFIETQQEPVTLVLVQSDMSAEAVLLYFNAIKHELSKDVQCIHITHDTLNTLHLTSAHFVDELLNEQFNTSHTHVMPRHTLHGHEKQPFASHHIFDDISETMATYILKNEMFGLTKQIQLVFQNMSYRRFKHTMRVVYRMQQLVAIYDDLDPIPAYFSALFHDYAKETPIEEQKMYVDRYFPTFSDVAPATYHGFAAAVELQQMDDTLDGDVYEAIAYHPIGIPSYCRIGLALMVADYCDFTRAHKEQWKQVWKTATTKSLEEAVYERIIFTKTYFEQSENNTLYTSTENMLEWLKELLQK